MARRNVFLAMAAASFAAMAFGTGEVLTGWLLVAVLVANLRVLARDLMAVEA